MLDRRPEQLSRLNSAFNHHKRYEAIPWILISCLCGILEFGCASSKPQTNANPNVQRTITYQGPIWVVNKKGQGQKFVQVKGPTWNSSGPPPEAQPDPTAKPAAAEAPAKPPAVN